MSNHDRKGRSKAGPRFVQLFYWMLESSAYRSLSAPARALLVELMMLYNGNNNGELFLSQRDAAERLNFKTHQTTRRYFDELKRLGFVRVKHLGSFDNKAGKATTWILTMFEYHGRSPTKDFMSVKGPKAKMRGGKVERSGMKNSPGGLKTISAEWPDGCDLRPCAKDFDGVDGADISATYNIPSPVGSAALTSASSPMLQ
ncbi:MAG: hypothetical protein V4618_00985 [Pseudomonadota bacterium]